MKGVVQQDGVYQDAEIGVYLEELKQGKREVWETKSKSGHIVRVFFGWIENGQTFPKWRIESEEWKDHEIKGVIDDRKDEVIKYLVWLLNK
jgi:hypothetical protein